MYIIHRCELKTINNYRNSFTFAFEIKRIYLKNADKLKKNVVNFIYLKELVKLKIKIEK